MWNLHTEFCASDSKDLWSWLGLYRISLLLNKRNSTDRWRIGWNCTYRPGIFRFSSMLLVSCPYLSGDCHYIRVFFTSTFCGSDEQNIILYRQIDSLCIGTLAAWFMALHLLCLRPAIQSELYLPGINESFSWHYCLFCFHWENIYFRDPLNH